MMLMSDTKVTINAGTREQVALEMTRDILRMRKFSNGEEYQRLMEEVYPRMLKLASGVGLDPAQPSERRQARVGMTA